MTEGVGNVGMQDIFAVELYGEFVLVDYTVQLWNNKCCIVFDTAVIELFIISFITNF